MFRKFSTGCVMDITARCLFIESDCRTSPPQIVVGSQDFAV